MKFSDIKQLTDRGDYSVNVSWAYLEKQIEEFHSSPGGFDLDPDFQRGNVWTEEQQIKFVEYALRGGLKHSGSVILLNCADWDSGSEQPIECVDGLQRLTAARRFMNNEIPAFGLFRNEFEGNLDRSIVTFTVVVNKLRTRAEVLQWYLDINSGGTVHAPEEIDRVRLLLEQELAGPVAQTPGGPR